MPIKDSNAAESTITYDRNQLDAPTGNIYKAVSILAKRAVQINEENKQLRLNVGRHRRDVEHNFIVVCKRGIILRSPSVITITDC